jgi:hypothetical protein
VRQGRAPKTAAVTNLAVMRQLWTTRPTTSNTTNMKQFLVFTLTIFTLTGYGQDKYNYVHFNKMTEVVGTEYVIALL